MKPPFTGRSEEMCDEPGKENADAALCVSGVHAAWRRHADGGRAGGAGSFSDRIYSTLSGSHETLKRKAARSGRNRAAEYRSCLSGVAVFIAGQDRQYNGRYAGETDEAGSELGGVAGHIRAV